MLTTRQRLGGLAHLLYETISQAQGYEKYLNEQIARHERGDPIEFSREPPPITNASLDSIDAELRDLSGQILGDGAPPQHFRIETHRAFQRRYARDNPVSHTIVLTECPLEGTKSVSSLARDYQGIMFWAHDQLTYVRYLVGTQADTPKQGGDGDES